MKFLTVLLATLLVAPVAGQAQGRLDKIRDTQQITLGVRESSIPFSYPDDTQKPVGPTIDISEGVDEALKDQSSLEQLKDEDVVLTSTPRIPLVANDTSAT